LFDISNPLQTILKKKRSYLICWLVFSKTILLNVVIAILYEAYQSVLVHETAKPSLTIFQKSDAPPRICIVGTACSQIETLPYQSKCLCLRVFACVVFEKIVRVEWATRKEEREKAAEEEEADSRLAKARKVILVFVLEFSYRVGGRKRSQAGQKGGTEFSADPVSF
jgi:hypothetical protein